MKSVALFSIISVVVSGGIIDLVPTDSDTLVLLHVLFRHGNRTPDKISRFPTDPYLNETFQPFGYSQLTTKGKTTEHAIGQYLRLTYGSFIPEQYTPEVAYSISTNFKRTKMSLELVLAGLFPPLLTDVFSVGLNWQPISFIVEEEENIIQTPLTNCANYIRQFYKYMLTAEAEEITAAYKELYQQLSEATGLDVRTPEEVFSIYETLESEHDYGLELPEWTSGIYPTVLEEAAAVYFEFATASPGLRRLTAGSLLKKILQDSLSKRDDSLGAEKKLFLYSAHDFNVATVLRALNVFHRHVPPYGATLFFEIHNVNGVYGLKLYYQDYTGLTPKLLTIPGCDSFCELDKFAELISDNFPTQVDVCTFNGELL
jgi:prostatic aicd phosphatase